MSGPGDPPVANASSLELKRPARLSRTLGALEDGKLDGIATPIESPADDFIVTLDLSDAENPLTWTRRRRWGLTMLASLLTMNASLPASAPSGASPSILADIGTPGIASLGAPLLVTTYLCVKRLPVLAVRRAAVARPRALPAPCRAY